MSLGYPLALGALLFGIGLYGALVRTNAIRILMCVELMLNAVNLNLVAFSAYITPGDMRGQIFALLVMTIAASEAAVGLAIIVVMARQRGLINTTKFNLLKG